MQELAEESEDASGFKRSYTEDKREINEVKEVKEWLMPEYLHRAIL